MAKTVRRVISGARIAFDPRTTREADTTRDYRNRVTDERPMRVARAMDRKRKQPT
jgi:hypothetical protein